MCARVGVLHKQNQITFYFIKWHFDFVATLKLFFFVYCFFFYFLFSFFDFKSVLTYYTLVSWHIHRRKYPNQWGKNRMNIDRLCDFLYGETCVAMNTILSFFFFYFSDSQFNRSDRIAIRDEWSQQKGDEEKKIEENRKEDDNNKEWWRRRQQQQPKKKFTLKR